MAYDSGRWCHDGNKITQQSAIKEGGTAVTAVIPTMEGRREWGTGQGDSKGGATMIGELTTVSSLAAAVTTAARAIAVVAATVEAAIVAAAVTATATAMVAAAAAAAAMTTVRQ